MGDRDLRTLVDVIHGRALRDPGRPAFTYLPDGENEVAARTYGELDAEVRAIATLLASAAERGDRAVLLYPHSLDFVRAFLGCLYAGIVAVPAYPARPGDEEGAGLIRRIAADSAASLVLTTADWAAAVPPELGVPSLVTDQGKTATPSASTPVRVDPEELAFLQYTSGSTASPKGVMVTHGNLLHAERMIAAAFEHSEESTLVGWLPLYHDMGLVGNVLQPLFIGAHSVLMPPEAFLQHPQRWLQAISRYGATTSGGPNFAYELCARRISPEQLDGVDLSCWSIAFNGAEPVRPRTIAAFSNAFACRGFSERAFYPCYGLAEVTLFASGGTKAARPRLIPIDADALASGTENVAHDTRGQTDPTPDDAVHVACGHGWLDRRIVIADPISGAEQPDGTVGEIWLSGADVTRGYWGRPEETQRTFAASLPNGDGPFLRTGDLGFVVGRELVVTGRSKDVIVVAGRNVYPQEIEATVEDSHPLIRRGCVAAFAYEADGAERVGLVTELRTADVPTEHIDSVAPAIRREVATRHGVALHAVSLIVRGSIAKTSSGKVRRSECRRRMLAGELALLSHSSLESMREAAVPS